MKQILKDMLSDEKGGVSHKRFISTIGAFILFGTFLWGKNEHIGELVFYLVCASMGLATIDKFTKK